nr:threonine dehydratase biosynthetic, chloroplastic [Tanacetum cinerariifolium]
VQGIVTATRGNHGQSLALAASAAGLSALLVVPQGNSVEKNNAMRALGGTVIECGRDFDEAREEAARLADVHGHYLVPPFHVEMLKDGLAVRRPIPSAFAIYRTGAARIIAVSDAEIADAMRVYYTDTHNLAEGAGAAALAGLMQERPAMAGKTVGVILSGGNVDRTLYARVIA